MIGCREYSMYGKNTALMFSEQLAKNNFTIVSGCARGIDSFAHAGTLKYKEKTIAVLGSGFNHIYPKENKPLYERIIKNGGAIISEYPPETEPDSLHFPKRNRIVSALSDGILMIEGKHRSGTTITAEYGIKQKKPVFCLPHSISNSYGTGPNSIIKKGGILVTNAQDIIKYYEAKNVKFIENENKKKYNNEILKLLSKEILTKEELALKLNKSISEINQELTILELEEIITQEYGKGYRIIE